MVGNCPPSTGWSYISDTNVTVSTNVTVTKIEPACPDELIISNSDEFHSSSIYNDIYEKSSSPTEHPVYTSYGKFPVKTIRWNAANNNWLIFGQAGEYKFTRFSSSSQNRCPPTSNWNYHADDGRKTAINLAIKDRVYGIY